MSLVPSYGREVSSFGLRPGDYRRVWNAGNAIGRSVKSWLGRRKDRTPVNTLRPRYKKKIVPKNSRHVAAPQMQFGAQIPEGHGHSLSKVFLGKSAVPKSLFHTLKSVASNRYVNTHAGVQLTCGVGVQSQYSPNVGAANYVDLNTMEASTDYWINGANSVGNATVAKWFLESFTGSLQMSNASAAAVTMTIFDCIARRDVASTNVYSPQIAWTSGVTDEGVANGANQVGSLPFESDLFTQFYKVVKSTKVILASGECHKHVFNMEPNQLLHHEYITQYSASNTGIYRDLSYFPLVVFSGMPAHDSTTKTSVSSAPVNLDTIFEVSYAFKYLFNNTVSWYRTNALASSFAVGEELFNEAVGQQQNAAGITPGVMTD